MQEHIDRVETWANTLKAGQAPHQQQLADDALVLVNHAKTSTQPYEQSAAADRAAPASLDVLDVGQAVTTVPRDTFDALAQERDDLAEQLETARGTIETMYDEKAALEAQLADLTSQLEAATTPPTPQPPQPDDVAE